MAIQASLLCDEILIEFGDVTIGTNAPYGRDQYTRMGHITIMGNNGTDYGLNTNGATWTASSSYSTLTSNYIGEPVPASTNGLYHHMDNTGYKWYKWTSTTARDIKYFQMYTNSGADWVTYIADFPHTIKVTFKRGGVVLRTKIVELARPTGVVAMEFREIIYVQDTVARLNKDGDLLVAGELNERAPAVSRGLVAYHPFDGTTCEYVPHVRYIRDWINGSSANVGNHWTEIQAIDYTNTNVALNKDCYLYNTVTTSKYAVTIPVDGNVDSASYCEPGTGLSYALIDLRQAYTLKRINVRHYYADGRVYYSTKTEVSEDGIVWYTVFDSAVQGTYTETPGGHNIDMEFPDKPKFVTWTGLTNVTTNGGGQITKSSAAAGWDAGAYSNEQIIDNGYVEFTLGNTGFSLFCGLSYGNTDASYPDVDFAIYISGTSTLVYEAGSPRGDFTSLVGANVVGDLFRVEVYDKKVRYYKNNMLFYTSYATPTLPMVVDTTIHYQTHYLSDVKIGYMAKNPIKHDGLIAYLPLTTSSYDMCGTYSGTISGIAWDPAGGALYDAAADYITIPAVSSSTITVDFYYKFTGLTTEGYNTLLGQNGGTYHHCLVNPSSIIGFYNAGWYPSSKTLTVGEEYHIVMVKNDYNCKLYVDGVLVLDSDSSFSNATYPLAAIGNYGAGGSQGSLGRIRELKIYNTCTPITSQRNQRTTQTGDGMYIEGATTNLWGPRKFQIYNNWGSAIETTLNELTVERYKGNPITRTTYKPTTTAARDDVRTQDGGHGVMSTAIFAFAANTAYTSSIIWRCDKPGIVVTGHAANVTGWGTTTTYDLGDGWKKSVCSFTNAAAQTDYKYWSIKDPSIGLNETLTIDITCPQMEQKAYATSYVQTTRPGAIYTLPPSFINLSACSISVEFFWEGTRVESDSWMMLCDAGTNGNGTNMVNIAILGTTLYTRLGNSAVSYGTTGGFSTTTLNAGKWNTYTITWNGSTKAYSECLNGTILSGTLSYVPDGAPAYFYVGSWFGPYHRSNMRLRNLAIYNVVLTSDELKKLSLGTMSVTSKELKAKSVKETPSGTNLGIHFPLGADSKSKGHLWTPSYEGGTMYENGSVWVGSAVTNLYPTPASVTDFSPLGNGIFVMKKTTNELLFEYDYTQNLTWTYHAKNMTVTSGYIYTVSVDVLITEDCNIPNTGTTPVADTEGAFINWFYYDNSRKGQWQRLTCTGTASTATLMFAMYPSTGAISATTGKVMYKNISVTNTAYVVPYVQGTRPYSVLSYPNVDKYTNDWQEFTFIVWVKLTDQNRWRLFGTWPKWYFGIHPSNVLNFAYQQSGVQINTATGATTIPLNQWTMIGCSVKVNDHIDLYVNGALDMHFAGAFQMNATGNELSLNDLVNGSTAYPINGWLRDVMICPTALTTAQVQAIYQQGMKNYKDGTLLVKGVIKEGMIG